jgi:hypothetical protein
MPSELFDESELSVCSPPALPARKERCGQCAHIQRWRNEHVSPSHAVNFYCGITHSNRTDNKLLKVKCKTPACDNFEMEREE